MDSGICGVSKYSALLEPLYLNGNNNIPVAKEGTTTGF